MRPRIGLVVLSEPPRRTPRQRQRWSAGYLMNKSYAAAVEGAGGLPVLIPHLRDDSLRELILSLDGLLLPGGPDIHPEEYGEELHPTTHFDRELDRVELLLARLALEKGVPILGICRGQQTLNVAAGGSLFQDLGSQIEGTLVHQNSGRPRHELHHPILVEPRTRLAGSLGDTRVEVNSFHHQSVKRLAPGFVVAARAPDGVIEAIERPGEPFVAAVQFHPEDLVPSHEPSRRLFLAFVEAAERTRASPLVAPRP